VTTSFVGVGGSRVAARRNGRGRVARRRTATSKTETDTWSDDRALSSCCSAPRTVMEGSVPRFGGGRKWTCFFRPGARFWCFKQKAREQQKCMFFRTLHRARTAMCLETDDNKRRSRNIHKDKEQLDAAARRQCRPRGTVTLSIACVAYEYLYGLESSAATPLRSWRCGSFGTWVGEG